MPEINCDVTNCSHNKDAVCFANRINVAGGNARESENTACASFLDRDHYSTLTNNTNDYGSRCLDLVCNVKSCTYNDNQLCTADAINVTGFGANIYQETNCSTFRER